MNRDTHLRTETKFWDPIFSTDRNLLEEDCAWVECKRRPNIDADGDDLSLFFKDSEDDSPSYEFDEVEEFCQGARWDELTSDASVLYHERFIWLDDRCSCPDKNEGFRRYSNPLSVVELHDSLQAPVWLNSCFLPVIPSKLTHLALAIQKSRPTRCEQTINVRKSPSRTQHAIPKLISSSVI
jgi:hypothetical protein